MGNAGDSKHMMNFSIRQVFYALSTFFGVIFLMFFGKPVLIPLAFALLISFILYPICCFLERKGVGRMWSILWTIIGVALLIAGIIFLFSSQIIKIISDFSNFTGRINELLATVTVFINKKIPIVPDLKKDDLIELGKKWFSKESGSLVKTSLGSATAIASGLVLSVIYTFLILLYRKGLKKAFVNFAAPDKRKNYAHMVDNMQLVGQKYLTGMFTLIIILGALNSTGLLLLGIDYAFFFGYLAAFLALIPFVGTTIGGALPTLYALMTYDSIWHPIGVILVFWFVQMLEGNFLSPTIVGGNLNLNALAAILALIVGGFIWGIPGMILSMPIMAIMKEAFENYEQLKPLSGVLRDDLYKEQKPPLNVKALFKKVFKK